MILSIQNQNKETTILKESRFVQLSSENERTLVVKKIANRGGRVGVKNCENMQTSLMNDP